MRILDLYICDRCISCQFFSSFLCFLFSLVRAGKPTYFSAVFNTLSPAIKQSWISNLQMAKLALGTVYCPSVYFHTYHLPISSCFVSMQLSSTVALMDINVGFLQCDPGAVHLESS